MKFRAAAAGGEGAAGRRRHGLRPAAAGGEGGGRHPLLECVEHRDAAFFHFYDVAQVPGGHLEVYAVEPPAEQDVFVCVVFEFFIGEAGSGTGERLAGLGVAVATGRTWLRENMEHSEEDRCRGSLDDENNY